MSNNKGNLKMILSKLSHGVLLAGMLCFGQVATGGAVFQADFKAGKLAVSGGTGVLKAWSSNKIKIKGSLMEVAVSPQTSGGMAGAVQLKPDSAVSSMGAIYKAGKLNGTIDFFIGSSRGLDKASPVNNFRVLDLDNRKRGGLRLVIMNVRDDLRVEILGDLVAPDGKKHKVLAYHGKFPMQPGKIYHVAVTFQTAADGLVTCKLYATDVDQSINTSGTPLRSMAFRLDNSVKNGFATGNFNYGQLSTADKKSFTSYFGRLTIYNSIPKQLPGIKNGTGGIAIPVIKTTYSKTAGNMPAVFFTGSNGGYCGMRMAGLLNKAGFNVNSARYPGLGNPLSWNFSRKYNVIVLSGIGESSADGRLTKGNRETLATLDKFLQNGGGILVLGHYGQRYTEKSPQDKLLNKLGLKPLWAEIPVDPGTSKVATAWQIDFAHTSEIEKSSITADVKSLWYPAPKRRIGAQHHTVAFTAGSLWHIVVTGSESSKTTHDYNGTMYRGKTSTYNQSVPLVACRQVGKGRIVYLGIGREYLQEKNADTVLEDIVNTKGLGGQTSDGLKLFINSIKWLAQPSLKSRRLGGAANNSNLLKDPLKVSFCKPFTWDNYGSPSVRKYDQSGIVGARTSYSCGKATPAEWVKAAKAQGLSFIAFLDDFKLLTPQKFEQLKADCKRLTNDKFAAFAGFTIDDEVGNHYFYFGSSLPLPQTAIIDKDKKVFVSHDTGLNRKNPYKKGQLSMTTLNYFISKCIGRLTGGNFRFTQDAAPFSDFFSNWNAMGVVTSSNGKLEEFVFDDYLKIVASGQGPTPIAITLVDSPEQLKNVKWKTVFKSGQNNTRAMLKYFNQQKFYPENPTEIYISSGPQINDWSFNGPRDYEYTNNGDFVWQNQRWQVKGRVSSSVGLKTVKVWDGTKLFRLFDPKGGKEFSFKLDFNHDKQHCLILEVIDNNGNIAVSRDQWDRNHRSEEFMCGDRNNQLSFSRTINKDGIYIDAGGNQSLATPYKRVDTGGIAPVGTFKNHPILGAPGFDGAVWGDPEFFTRIKLKTFDGTQIKSPNVAESKRLLHTGDVNIGEVDKAHRFTDNIQVANVWHTLWKTEPADKFITYARNYYFQLDPDQPLALFQRSLKVTLKQDIKNSGFDFGQFIPRKAKSFAVYSADRKLIEGNWSQASESNKIDVDFSSGAYVVFMNAPLGAVAVFSLTNGLKGTMGLKRKGNFQITLPADKSPQQAGGSAEADFILLGIPRYTKLTSRLPRNPLDTVKRFYKDFGLDGKAPAYKLAIKSGTVTSQKYILKVDGSADKCFDAVISGDLISSLPVKVSGMNDNWSAFLFDSKVGKARPVGVLESTAWATIIVKGQQCFVGHPVIANNDKLHIQVTHTGEKSWQVEFHNPTSGDITAKVKINKWFVPLKGRKISEQVTVKAGSSIIENL
jgi:hypothetical protein